MKKYALVQGGKIIKFKNVLDDDNVILPKLLAHSYLPVEEQAPPVRDQITQVLTDRYEVREAEVVRVWTIEERPFEEAKMIKHDNIINKALDSIRGAFGEPDESLKIEQILAVKNQQLVEIGAAKTNQDLRAEL